MNSVQQIPEIITVIKALIYKDEIIVEEGEEAKNNITSFT